MRLPSPLSLLRCALLLLAGLSTAYAGPAKNLPLWSVPETTLLGFQEGGLPVTRTYDRPARRYLSRLDVRDPATGRVVDTADLPGIPSGTYMLAFTPDLKTLAWENGSTLSIVTPTRRWTASMPGLHGTRELLFSPDGGTLAVANNYGYVQLWDTATGKRRTTLKFLTQPSQLRFSPDGQMLAVNMQFVVRGRTSLSLWKTTGAFIGTVPSVQGASRGAFEFSADGKEILIERPGYVLGWVSLNDGSVRRWQSYVKACTSGRPCIACARVCRYTLHASLNAARDRALIWTNDGAAMLYDARVGTQLLSLRPELLYAKLSADGRWAYGTDYNYATAGVLRGWKLP